MDGRRLTLDEGTLLVRMARESVTGYLKSGKIPNAPENLSANLRAKSGVFATLNRFGKPSELRGCIGYPFPELSLAEATIRSAIGAATADSRFESVQIDELDCLVVEVSVLTDPEVVEIRQLADIAKMIEVGRHGLMVERGRKRGLLLPQVAMDWKWESEEFLGNCCIKAGLPPDCWLLKDTVIRRFEAAIFEEIQPGGEVKIKGK